MILAAAEMWKPGSGLAAGLSVPGAAKTVHAAWFVRCEPAGGDRGNTGRGPPSVALQSQTRDNAWRQSRGMLPLATIGNHRRPEVYFHARHLSCNRRPGTGDNETGDAHVWRATRICIALGFMCFLFCSIARLRTSVPAACSGRLAPLPSPEGVQTMAPAPCRAKHMSARG